MFHHGMQQWLLLEPDVEPTSADDQHDRWAALYLRARLHVHSAQRWIGIAWSALRLARRRRLWSFLGTWLREVKARGRRDLLPR